MTKLRSALIGPKRSPFAGRWAGRVVACLASGPSLTAEDCTVVREHGIPAIVTNTTFRMAPWAEVLIGHDLKWWTVYDEEVRRTFAGDRLCCSLVPKTIDAINALPFLPGRGFGNSGAAAIALAMHAGARRVLLLGYDCKRGEGGKAHWHDAHPSPLGDAKSMPRWAAKFSTLAVFTNKSGVDVVNCSRSTALKAFRCGVLEDEIDHVAIAA
jgi:hypothetical protein